jgi:heptose-I-phosphate ethanolaminephosphotransferase
MVGDVYHSNRMEGFGPAAVGRSLWRWRWLLLMNLYLISPVLLYEGRLADKSFLFTLPASIFGLLALQLIGPRRVWVTHACLFPFYITVGMDLFTIFNYQTRFTSNMIVLVVGNLENAVEFLEGDFVRTSGSILAVVAGFAICMYKIRDLRVTVPRTYAILPLLALIACYVAASRHLQSWHLVTLNDRSSPLGIFSQGYLTYALRQEETQLREAARSFKFQAQRPASPPDSEIYVLVVGESARRHNFGLYGYGRDTTPRLSKTANLIAFQDVVTQTAQTQKSVPLILTRGNIEDRERAAREKSVLSLFQEVGFRTYWLSSQQREIAMAAISHYSEEADVVRFFERQHDIILIDSMREILAREGDRHKKRFFLLHMLGSHFNLTSRYPPSFARYDDGRGQMKVLTAWAGLLTGNSATFARTNLINAYDNTILYTDHVLSELVALLDQQPGIKTLMYVSDHGDNLRDDDRNLFGHAHENEYDLPIPLLFWYSDQYAQRFPEKVATARTNQAHRLTTRTVFYSLADMAEIRLNDPDLPRLSVFSPRLDHPKRMVRHPAPFDFDEWLARTIKTIPPGKVPQ